jgi:hypothetical protein
VTSFIIERAAKSVTIVFFTTVFDCQPDFLTGQAGFTKTGKERSEALSFPAQALS